MVHGDSALRRLLYLDRLPSSDAAGDWLRRAGESEGLAGLDRVNQRVLSAGSGSSGAWPTRSVDAKLSVW
ncbi:hypothetical protein HF289_05140 [Acidithiobacillus ferrooxidans]|jgi:hypothetical protein|uniref:hypothetical protein n=1 Tax=Acidithiobacillus ferrooxidans TaxID=920 RepID=UPI001C06C612|nr:hypothetical protein [Acidithiobacillus ferrooxidans]MBU2856280.1 hypothetical protein [Acidithiobacillus ferrooxidans]MBU2858881.1 hypothetical protein [Acidithiobacillus ferrooxidans]MCR2829204.1 hypothetical protein [Acidithiobacillus ferrooxidans]